MTGNTKYHIIYYISFTCESYRTILCEKMPLIKNFMANLNTNRLI